MKTLEKRRELKLRCRGWLDSRQVMRRAGRVKSRRTLECLGVQVRKTPARLDLPAAIPVSTDARETD
jgi:hypothetical protein